MKRPVVVEINKHRGPSAATHRRRRDTAVAIVGACLNLLDRAVGHLGADFAMEVYRILVRSLAMRMSNLSTPERAMGVLAGAEAYVEPAWRGEKVEAAWAEDAEALFARPASR